MVLALQELSHWLEGADQPFIVWTNHKNLAYLRSARRLNSHQAWWPIFLDLATSSRMISPLSWSRRVWRLSPRPLSPTHPPSCQVGAIMWEIKRLAHQTQPDQSNGPRNTLFVPDSVRLQVLQWSHSSRLTCHPGLSCTLDIRKQQCWWPTMLEDTSAFVSKLCLRPWKSFT